MLSRGLLPGRARLRRTGEEAPTHSPTQVVYDQHLAQHRPVDTDSALAAPPARASFMRMYAAAGAAGAGRRRGSSCK